MPHAETLHQVSDCGRVSRCNSRILHSTVEHFLDHFDHVKKLAGVEHIGVGSDIDLDGYDDMPAEENKRLRAGYKCSYGFCEKIDIEGGDHPKRIFGLTEGLIRRKYTDREIELALGGISNACWRKSGLFNHHEVSDEMESAFMSVCVIPRVGDRGRAARPGSRRDSDR